jgi:uncharacterized protein (TIGR00369 family)
VADDPRAAPQPPPGYVPAEGRGNFSTHNGPYYYRPGEGEMAEQAFFALERHCNGMGFVHGGMLSAFMDGVLAGAAYRGSGGKIGVTIHLSIDFLHMARRGEWVMGEARATRVTSDVAFVEGRAFVGARDVVRCSGVFKLMKRPR